MDLEKFFDRVNHDVLMSRLARQIEDQRILRLIRRYWQAGMMAGGMVSPPSEGTPQGGPLALLLTDKFNLIVPDRDPTPRWVAVRSASPPRVSRTPGSVPWNPEGRSHTAGNEHHSNPI